MQTNKPVLKRNAASKFFVMVVSSAFAISGSSCSDNQEQKKAASPAQEVPEGRVEESFHRNGRLWTRGFIVDGKYEGYLEQWWENGTLIQRQKLRHGVLVDTMLNWHATNGQLSEMNIFEDGNPVWTQSWDENGRLYFQKIRIKDSTHHTMRWDEKGTVVVDTMEVRRKMRYTVIPPEIGS